MKAVRVSRGRRGSFVQARSVIVGVSSRIEERELRAAS